MVTDNVVCHCVTNNSFQSVQSVPSLVPTVLWCWWGQDSTMCKSVCSEPLPVIGLYLRRGEKLRSEEADSRRRPARAWGRAGDATKSA